MKFTVTAWDRETRARLGILELAHGTVHTPCFMPVGTAGTVKGMTPEELLETGAEIVLGNTYHLWLRPGLEVVEQAGGLHRFMNWARPILTDSGGYQVFSLSELRTISREGGVIFRDHISGALRRLDPETAVDIQRRLGADIIMVLDECPPYPSEREYACASLDMTIEWALRCRRAHRDGGQTLFGILQGGVYEDLRRKSAEELEKIGFAGYGIGGLSVGEPKVLMYELAEISCGLLPVEKPRYLMGSGTPEDIVVQLAFGADMFDCTVPTRYGRNGTVFTRRGKMTVRNAAFKHDHRPIEEGCGCYVCRRYSRAYLRHLYNAGEILGSRLGTWHNLYFYQQMMREAREAIAAGEFAGFRRRFLDDYHSGSAA